MVGVLALQGMWRGVYRALSYLMTCLVLAMSPMPGIENPSVYSMDRQLIAADFDIKASKNDLNTLYVGCRGFESRHFIKFIHYTCALTTAMCTSYIIHAHLLQPLGSPIIICYHSQLLQNLVRSLHVLVNSLICKTPARLLC